MQWRVVHVSHLYAYKRSWRDSVPKATSWTSHIGVILGGMGVRVPPHFGLGVPYPLLFTSCHSCGTTRLLQHFAYSLARFLVEKIVRKWVRGGNGEDREGKADMVPPLFSPKWRLWLLRMCRSSQHLIHFANKFYNTQIKVTRLWKSCKNTLHKSNIRVDIDRVTTTPFLIKFIALRRHVVGKQCAL